MNFRQGDIVKLNFNPALGHEQAGYRPAVIISRKFFNDNTAQLIVCPITSKAKPFPTRLLLDNTSNTQGYVICDHVKTIDMKARNPKFIERLSEQMLDSILEIVNSQTQKEEYENG